jgi:hypothetical protein
LGTCFVLHPLLTTPREGCSPTLIHSLAPCISVCHIGCTESVARRCYYHVILTAKPKSNSSTILHYCVIESKPILVGLRSQKTIILECT